jgi:iron complex outermembrane recepter protein
MPSNFIARAVSRFTRGEGIAKAFTYVGIGDDAARFFPMQRNIWTGHPGPHILDKGIHIVTKSANFINRSRLRSGVAPVVLGLALISAPAFAQDKPAAAKADEGEIIVTGSRIPQPNLTSTAPVTVIDAASLKVQGTSRIEDALNALPQVYGGQTSALSNGATGTATIDLRDLGSTRTLVLVNGRRLLPGDPISSAADLNAIPAALVKRVEVLTGGASATYGADAVAGVVNFLLDTNFTGVKIDGQYSLYQHSNRNKLTPPLLNARTAAGAPGFGFPQGSVADGGTVDANISVGAGFDDNRGHVVGYIGYRKVNAVLQARRDYSSCTVQNNPANPNATPGNAANPLRCGGSATSANGNFFDSTSNAYTISAGQTFQPGLQRFNFAPANYFQRPDERYTAGFFAHYDVSDAIKPYTEFMFMDDRTVAQIAPSGDFGNTLTINCDNPLLSAQQLGIVCRPDNLVNGFLGNFPLTANTNPDAAATPINFTDPVTGATYNQGYAQILRRNVEGGPRRNDLQHTQFRAVIGSKGELGKAWSYDAYYQYGRTNYAQTYSNELSISRLKNALDVVAGPGGTPVCRTATTTTGDRNCVPYNIFTLGSVTPAATNYLAAVGFQRGTLSEQIASASFSGHLGEYGFKTPWADQGIDINIGAEYRKESLDLQTDQEFQTGDLAGQGAATLPINGSFNVVELFGEAQVPLVHDGFVKDLSFNGGYRYSHYKISNGNTFNTNTFKLGVEFAPIKDLTFRASFNRAVRAPNIQDLFAVRNVALDGTSDPCAGAADANNLVNGLTAAQCALSGVTAGQFGNISSNPAGQYNGLLGGTPSLTPERATTKSFGVVFQPSFAPRLSLTVDYFDIKVTNAIQRFGADAIINACVNTANALACGLINRNPVNGSLWLTPDGFIRDVQQNIGGVKTSGIDVNGAYSTELGKAGKLSLSFVGTYLRNFITDNGLTVPYDCAGFYGTTCGTPAPKWRHSARATFDTPSGIQVSLQWRHFSSAKIDFSSTNASLAGTFYPFATKLNSQDYFDLSTSIAVSDHANFRLGVNNLLDRQPPLVSSGNTAVGAGNGCASVSCNGNTYPGVYDALGRYLFASFSLNF